MDLLIRLQLIVRWTAQLADALRCFLIWCHAFVSTRDQ